MTSVLDLLSGARIVPVVTADSSEQGLGIARALAAGGLPVAEVTFRTPAAAAAIAAIRGGTDVLVGAGTVLTVAHVDEAVAAGAAFVVSPGLSRAVIDRCREHGVPVLPGAVTATEIQAAVEAGIDVVKFFPAETSGGGRRAPRAERAVRRDALRPDRRHPRREPPRLPRAAGRARGRRLLDAAGRRRRGGRLDTHHGAHRGRRRATGPPIG